MKKCRAGSCVDEVILWDQDRVWVYTQDQQSSGEHIYAPHRNPDYNESNYRTVVSRPGWNQHHRQSRWYEEGPLKGPLGQSRFNSPWS